MTRALFFAAAVGAAIGAFADDSPISAAEQHPGYGVVQSITRVSAAPAEESASTGKRVLITNAGDVLPE